MIVEMRKLNLVAMSYERDAILNALHKSNAAEIKLQTEEAETVPVQTDGEPLKEYHASLVNALEVLIREADSYAKEKKIRLALPKDGFEVSYEQFMNAASDREQADALVREIGAMVRRAERVQGETYKTYPGNRCGAAVSHAESTVFLLFGHTSYRDRARHDSFADDRGNFSSAACGRSIGSPIVKRRRSLP